MIGLRTHSRPQSTSQTSSSRSWINSRFRREPKEFAVRVLKLVEHLPHSVAGRAIGNQIVRSATSVGANYRAACRARSKAEFIAKLGIVVEEADESLYWLELIVAAGLLVPRKVSLLLKEANELTAIFNSARYTSTRRVQNVVVPSGSPKS